MMQSTVLIPFCFTFVRHFHLIFFDSFSKIHVSIHDIGYFKRKKKICYLLLETLWTVGGEYDDLTREAGRPSPLEQLISSSLDQFQPLDEDPEPSDIPSDELNKSAEERSDRAGGRR
jgi:hypothetical protein